MLGALVTILIIAVFAGLIYWVLDAIPVPQPINKFAKIAVVVLAVIALIYVLAGLGGLSIPR